MARCCRLRRREKKIPVREEEKKKKGQTHKSPSLGMWNISAQPMAQRPPIDRPRTDTDQHIHKAPSLVVFFTPALWLPWRMKTKERSGEKWRINGGKKKKKTKRGWDKTPADRGGRTGPKPGRRLPWLDRTLLRRLRISNLRFLSRRR